MKKSIIVLIVILFSIGGYANIKFTPNQVHVGQIVNFSIDNPKGCTACKWDFGDGTVINGVADNVSVKHTFISSGNYTITFTSGGCIETPSPVKTLVVTVLDNRSIVINPQNPKANTKIMIELKNAIKTPVKWDFGDGSNTTGDVKVYHIYKNPGNYKITAIDSGAQNAPVSFNAQVSPDPRSVDYAPKAPHINENINFTAKQFQSDSIKWDFGDGMIQSGSGKMVHKYAHQGNFNVKVYDRNGEDDSPIIFNINILGDTRKIVVNPKTAHEGENIDFTAKNFKSPNILWDFGDGVKKKGNLHINHFYRKNGFYEIKAFDNNGNDKSPVKIKIQILKDIRNVSWEPKNPYAKTLVNFRLISVSSNEFNWRFGDGKEKRAFGKTISHIYDREGAYTIKIFDMKNKFLTPILSKITIMKDPRKVEVQRRSVRVGEKNIFKALNFKVNNLLWDFGDGVKKTGGNKVIHTYKKQGLFNVKVQEKQGTNSKKFGVSVTVLPDTRKLEIFPNNVKVGKEIEIKAVNFYSNKVSWDFGDGVKKIDSRNVKHIYRKAGQFKIKAIDYSGKDSKIFELNIVVKIEPSQASDLIISGGELFFKNNYKNFLIVPKDYKGIEVITKLKYEGTGTLLAYWLIDGQKYKAINENLSFGQNKKFVFKNVPALLIGLHKIGFSIYSPKSKIELKGYYFVSTINKKIKLLSPSDRFKTGNKRVSFQWSKLNLRNTVYILRLASNIGKLFNNPEIEKVTMGNKISVNLSRLIKGKEYYWIIEARLKKGKTLSVSEIRKIKIKQ
jgi:PKD repeat protein